jgi:PepSY-associated TM region
MTNQEFSFKMRIIHRYLGFFLVGIMLVYSISGIILIFRDTDFLKSEKQITKQVKPNATAEELGKMLQIKDLKIDKEEGNIAYFKAGTYDKTSGTANYKVKELPKLIEKMTHLHKAKSADPLFFLNIFFGLSLFFFVISSFWMFMPSTSTFKKGMYFTLGGIVLTLILLFI